MALKKCNVQMVILNPGEQEFIKLSNLITDSCLTNIWKGTSHQEHIAEVKRESKIKKRKQKDRSADVVNKMSYADSKTERETTLERNIIRVREIINKQGGENINGKLQE